MLLILQPWRWVRTVRLSPWVKLGCKICAKRFHPTIFSHATATGSRGCNASRGNLLFSKELDLFAERADAERDAHGIWFFGGNHDILRLDRDLVAFGADRGDAGIDIRG